MYISIFNGGTTRPCAAACHIDVAQRAIRISYLIHPPVGFLGQIEVKIWEVKVNGFPKSSNIEEWVPENFCGVELIPEKKLIEKRRNLPDIEENGKKSKGELKKEKMSLPKTS